MRDFLRILSFEEDRGPDDAGVVDHRQGVGVAVVVQTGEVITVPKLLFVVFTARLL
jgi:hypothetical protein